MAQLYRYPNGLRLVYQYRPGQVTALDLFVGVGSGHEPESLRGGSHLIEHMLFKGTPSLPSTKSVNSVFDSVGAYVNAYTSKEVTCYVVKCGTIHAEQCLETLVDMLRNSLMLDTEIEREKQIVIEENNKDDDDPSSLLIDNVYKLLFKGNPISFPTGADTRHIKAIRTESLVAYYRTYYVPENMVLSVCTDMPFEEIQRLADKTQLVKGTHKSQALPPVRALLDAQTEVRRIFVERSIEQTHIGLGFRTVPMYHPDKYPLSLLKQILVGGLSSRLYVLLREEHGMIYNIGIDDEMYRQVGGFTIMTSVDHQKASDALDLIMRVLEDIKRNGVTDDELARAKGYIKGTLMLEAEDASNISQHNGKQIISDYPESQFHTFDQIPHYYDRVTTRDIMRVTQQYFTKSRMTLVILGKSPSLGKRGKAGALGSAAS